MSLADIAKNAITEELDRVAEMIEGELKNACPSKTGRARSAIHTEHTGEYERFVGGTDLHLYFADEGNNQRLGTIYPVRARALRFTDGSFHASASTYEGRHFVKAVADRHR